MDEDEKKSINNDYMLIRNSGASKKKAIEELSQKYGRGYWSILRVVDGTTNRSTNKIEDQYSLL